jgi:hypothetical protein
MLTVVSVSCHALSIVSMYVVNSKTKGERKSRSARLGSCQELFMRILALLFLSVLFFSAPHSTTPYAHFPNTTSARSTWPNGSAKNLELETRSSIPECKILDSLFARFLTDSLDSVRVQKLLIPLFSAFPPS